MSLKRGADRCRQHACSCRGPRVRSCRGVVLMSSRNVTSAPATAACMVRPDRCEPRTADRFPDSTASSSPGPSVRPSISRRVRPRSTTRMTRPVPGQTVDVRSASTLPVSRNRPDRGSSSTARLTAPRTCGSRARVGLSPSSMPSGSSPPHQALGDTNVPVEHLGEPVVPVGGGALRSARGPRPSRARRRVAPERECLPARVRKVAVNRADGRNSHKARARSRFTV